MRNSVLSFALIAIAMFACKEERHGVSYTLPEKPLLDTTYTVSTIPAAQNHDVLLFDITGVRCSNCPDAARIAHKIADTLNPGRVVVVALHPNNIALKANVWPWEGGYDTMSNDDAESLNQYLGGVTLLPMGCVDQISVSGTRFLQRSAWVSYVNNRLAFITPLNIDLNTRWDLVKNRGRLEIKITYTKDVSNKNLVFMGIIESGMIGKQSNPSGSQTNYEFDDVLRRLISAPTGDSLRADLKVGRVFEKQYYINPRYNWNPKNLAAVVWVVDATTKEVLQVAEAKLQP